MNSAVNCVAGLKFNTLVLPLDSESLIAMADFGGGPNRDDAPGESDRDRGKCKSVIVKKKKYK